MGELKYRAVKGMGDVFPAECRRWSALEGLLRSVAERYDYGEIRVPLVEPTELFVRSIGEGTDIVEKEMFSFADAGEKSLTLRPEGTAGVVRAYLEGGLPASSPFARFYYLGPMFRRERPQAGRRRQFHQFGVEALGLKSPALDAETIDLLVSALAAAGAGEMRLSLNSVGCPACRPSWQSSLREYFSIRRDGLCEHCRGRLEKNVLRVLDCKNPRCRAVAAGAPRTEAHLCASCREHFDAVLAFLRELGVAFAIDPLLVRGLDYYTGTVFEVRSSRLGAQDAVAAGGRYDNLIAELGGPELGAVGFSIGMERLLICLEGVEIAPPPPAGRFVYAVSLGTEAFRKNFLLIASLRQRGTRGELDFQGRSLKAQMREANRLGADRVVIRGEEELKAGKVKIKEMKSGEEALVEEGEAVERLMGMVQQS